MTGGELPPSEPLDKEFRGRYRVLRIVAFMRWVSLLVGPIAIIVDRIIEPWMSATGLPSVLTMEDITQFLLYESTGLSNYISEEEFLGYYHHLNIICCALFAVFVIWFILAKRKAVGAAEELALLEQRMGGGL